MSRFEIELEFVQCLSNPYYLHHLSREGTLDTEQFKDLLEYLSYWRTPEYSQHLLYPQALNILTLLKDPAFVKSLSNPLTIDFLIEQQYLLWRSPPS